MELLNICYGMPTQENLRDFAIFLNSARESQSIIMERSNMQNMLIQCMYQAAQMDSMQAMNFAMNAQQDIHRRQNQIHASLQQRSAMINDTYNNRVAAQNRMWQNTSEAIRGVDTYTTANGTTEFRVGAERVIQNNKDSKQKAEIGYLDEVPDGWTEIFKQ